MKKVISIILSTFLAIAPITTVSAYADNIEDTIIEEPIIEEYAYTKSKNATLTINGTTAKCECSLKGSSSVTKVEVFMHLQKTNGYLWPSVAIWTDSADGKSLSLDKEAYGLTSGTYRVKADFFVYTATDTETVTVYSETVTI